MKYTVWVSRSDDLGELLNIDNDVLSFSGLSWTQAMDLFQLSLAEGYLLVLAKEEREAGGDDGTPETC